MLFNSVAFLIFFPLVTLLFFLLPHPIRWAHLLLASCVFYAYFVPIYLTILGFTIAVDFVADIMKRLLRLLGHRARQRARHVLQADGTRVRVVVSPLYDQIRMNPADVAALREIFGHDDVLEFSGDNGLTEDVQNYYESSHFRRPVAREILKTLYARRRPDRSLAPTD